MIQQQKKAPTWASVAKRIVLWFFSLLSLGLVVGFITLIAYLGTGTPFTAAVGHSMNPTLYEGDLAVIRGVEPSKVKSGDVIRFNVTVGNQQKYGLPGTILHRVVSVRNSSVGLLFTTKGDNNAQNDVFETRADNVTGVMVNKFSRFGYVILWIQSPSAPILGIVAIALIASYILISWLETSMNAAKEREKVFRELALEIPILTQKIEALSSRVELHDSDVPAKDSKPAAEESASNGKDA
jgi:signal peptidase I